MCGLTLLFSFCRRNPKFRAILPELKNRGDQYSLKTLAECLLGKNMQQGDHNAVEDAQTSLYLFDEEEWEANIPALM